LGKEIELTQILNFFCPLNDQDTKNASCILDLVAWAIKILSDLKSMSSKY
jgi:hypothetical protein